MSLLKKLFRLFLSAAESPAEMSGPEASARASELHTLAMEAYKAGGDHNELLRKRARATLQRYQRNIPEKVEIQAANDSCKACKAQDGQVLTVEGALREMPIPCEDCSRPLRKSDDRGFCRCTYLPVMDLT